MNWIAWQNVTGSDGCIPPDLASIGLKAEGSSRSWAAFDRPYRYLLGRNWEVQPSISMPKIMLWICMNPSLADAVDHDPSVGRMISFAKREKCTGLIVTNVMAYITPYPKDLLKVENPTGPKNHAAISWAISRPEVQIVVAGWGSIKGKALRARSSKTIEFLAQMDSEKRIYCLGRNSDDSPKHPLYLSSAQTLEVFW